MSYLGLLKTDASRDKQILGWYCEGYSFVLLEEMLDTEVALTLQRALGLSWKYSWQKRMVSEKNAWGKVLGWELYLHIQNTWKSLICLLPGLIILRRVQYFLVASTSCWKSSQGFPFSFSFWELTMENKREILSAVIFRKKKKREGVGGEGNRENLVEITCSLSSLSLKYWFGRDGWMTSRGKVKREKK